MHFRARLVVSPKCEASSKRQGDGQRFQKKAMKATKAKIEASAPANVRPSSVSKTSDFIAHCANRRLSTQQVINRTGWRPANQSGLLAGRVRRHTLECPRDGWRDGSEASEQLPWESAQRFAWQTRSIRVGVQLADRRAIHAASYESSCELVRNVRAKSGHRSHLRTISGFVLSASLVFLPPLGEDQTIHGCQGWRRRR
jgi:hypothetical protein